MSDPMPPTGVVYAIERADLMRVYVGQSKCFGYRVKRHRRENTQALFSNADPVVRVVSAHPLGRELSDAERATAVAYEAAGWDVVSHNTEHIGYSSAAGSAGGKVSGKVTGQQHVDSGHMARIQSIGAALGGRATAGRPQPMAQINGRAGGLAGGKRGGQAVSRVRRQCTDCGLTSNPGAMSRHFKVSDHSGYVDLPPAD